MFLTQERVSWMKRVPGRGWNQNLFLKDYSCLLVTNPTITAVLAAITIPDTP